MLSEYFRRKSNPETPINNLIEGNGWHNNNSDLFLEIRQIIRNLQEPFRTLSSLKKDYKVSAKITNVSYTANQVLNLDTYKIRNLHWAEVNIEYISRGKTAIFPAYTRLLKEEKTMSLSMQIDINHTIRVYKIGGKWLVATTKINEEIIKKALTLPFLDDNKEEILQKFLKDPQSIVKKEDNTEIIKKEVIKLFEANKTIQILNLEASIAHTKRRIDNFERDINSLFKLLTETQYTLWGLINSEENNTQKEVAEFILNVKNIRLNYLDNTRITVTALSPIINYDRDFLEVFLPRKYFQTANLTRQGLQKIFLNDEYTLYAKAVFSIYPAENKIVAERYVKEFTNDNSFYNPHIYNARCMGTYKSAMNKALQNQNYIELMNLLIASTGSLNWADTGVIEAMLSKIYNNTEKSIKNNETGELIDFAELTKRIKEEQNAPNTNE